MKITRQQASALIGDMRDGWRKSIEAGLKFRMSDAQTFSLHGRFARKDAEFDGFSYNESKVTARSLTLFGSGRYLTLSASYMQTDYDEPDNFLSAFITREDDYYFARAAIGAPLETIFAEADFHLPDSISDVVFQLGVSYASQHSTINRLQHEQLVRGYSLYQTREFLRRNGTMVISHPRFSFLRRSVLALSLSGAIVFANGVGFSSSATVAAPVVGTSAAVRGNVFVSTSGAQRKAQVRDAIKLQDQVVTKDDSALQILLLDRSTFTVGQNCSMVIDRFVYDPDTSVGQISAKVAKGAFRFMSGRIGKNNPTNATVSTPSATIGIRGTFFEGVVGEDAVALAQLGGIDAASANPAEASIIILRGPGRRRNTLDNPGIIEISNSGGSVKDQ